MLEWLLSKCEALSSSLRITKKRRCQSMTSLILWRHKDIHFTLGHQVNDNWNFTNRETLLWLVCSLLGEQVPEWRTVSSFAFTQECVNVYEFIRSVSDFDFAEMPEKGERGTLDTWVVWGNRTRDIGGGGEREGGDRHTFFLGSALLRNRVMANQCILDDSDRE
jgi:hypothetical protein